VSGAEAGPRRDVRWRGREVSRLEAFSDCVFAFALTLLVVSLDVPKTFAELVSALRGFPVFAGCFLAFLATWRAHYLFFRRFGLDDRTTMWLNSALLFVVLFAVYPLKFTYRVLMEEELKGGGGEAAVRDATGHVASAMGPGDWPRLMALYSLGFVAVFLVFALLYLHAWRRRGALALDPVEALFTRARIESNALLAAVAVVSVAVAVAGNAPLAGLAYLLNLPVQWLHWSLVHGRRTRGLAAG
jgi:F0F1-type ATP synthase assembly protein I